MIATFKLQSVNRQQFSAAKIVKAIGVALVLMALAPAINAQTWNAGAGDGLWSSGNNWSTTVVPTATGTALFNNTSGANSTITVTSNTTIGNISFSGNATAPVSNFVISGGSFILNNGGSVGWGGSAVQTAGVVETINSNFLLSSTVNGSATFQNGVSTSHLILGGNISGQAASGTTTINFNQGGTLSTAGLGITVNGVIGNGAGGGTVAVNKSGAVRLNLTGNNTYTGATTIGQSIVTLMGTSGAITGTSGITIASGATLQIGDSITVANNIGVTNRINDSAVLTLSGTNASQAVITMALPGSGSTTETVGGLTLAANSINAINTVNTGGNASIALGAYTRNTGSVVTVANTAGFTASATNSGSSIIAGALVGAIRAGNDFQTTTGAATAYSNNLTTWSSGTFANYSVGSSTTNVTANGTIAGLRLATSGTSTINLSGTNVIETGMITNAGGANTMNISGGNLTSGNGQDLIFLGGDSAFTMVVGSNITNNGGTAIGVTVASGKGVTLNGNNTYTGGTILHAGTTTIGNDNALGNGTLTLAGGSLTASGARTLTNAVAVSSATTLSGSNDLTLAGNITGSTALTISSTGITTFSGNNTGLTPAVVVNAGATLALGSSTAAGATGVNLGLGGTVTSSDATARSVNLSGFANGVTSNGLTFGRAGTGDLTVTNGALGASPYLYTINNTNTIFSTTQSSGAGATITKAGAGTLIFTGAWTMTGMTAGGVNITAGNLQIGNGSTTGALIAGGANGTITGSAGANLVYNRSDAIAATIPITGSIGLIQSGTGNTTLSGANTYSGNTTVSAGTLILSGTGFSANSSVINVASGATLSVSGVTGGFNLGSSQTLKGNGTVLGNTTISGNLQPGNSPGLLTVNGTLTLNGTAITTMEISGNGTRGTAYDGINVSSSLNYGGNLTLAIGTTFGVGTYSFNLFDFTGQTGNFANVALSGNYTGSFGGPSGGNWTLTQANGFGGNNTWTFAQSSGDLGLSVVPEPVTWSLLAASLTVVVTLRRRRRQE